MAEQAYDMGQLCDFARLTDIISRCPPERRSEIVRVVEAMILGAEIASRAGTNA